MNISKKSLELLKSGLFVLETRSVNTPADLNSWTFKAAFVDERDAGLGFAEYSKSYYVRLLSPDDITREYVANINDMISVVLTPKGEKIWKDFCPFLSKGYCEETKTLTEQLWVVMNCFVEEMKVGREACFVNNNITFKESI